MRRWPRELAWSPRRRPWPRSRTALLIAGLALGGLLLVLAHDRVRTERTDRTQPEGSGGPASVVYSLCEDDLTSFGIVPPRRAGERFAIAAQLDARATAELEELTADNLGRRLEIVIGNWLFLEGPIRFRVQSGRLVNTVFTSREQAEAALRRLRAELPKGSCGPQA